MFSNCVDYHAQKPPKPQTKRPLYQLQVEEDVTHGRKPEPAAYKGLIKLRITATYNNQKE